MIMSVMGDLSMRWSIDMHFYGRFAMVSSKIKTP
jgi:hypothetical protein